MNTNTVLRRIGAVIVDGIILFVISAAVLGLLALLGLDLWNYNSYSGDDGFSFEAETNVWGAIVSGLIGFAYKAFQEAKYGGQTIGKRALGIRVVQQGSGLRIDSNAAMIRAAFWQAPFTLTSMGTVLSFIGMLWLIAGLIALIASPDRQRLGDRFAHTVVVRDDPTLPAVALTPSFGLGQASGASGAAPGLQATSMVLCSFCHNRFTLNLADTKTVNGQQIRICPNCGAPIATG